MRAGRALAEEVVAEEKAPPHNQCHPLNTKKDFSRFRSIWRIEKERQRQFSFKLNCLFFSSRSPLEGGSNCFLLRAVI